MNKPKVALITPSLGMGGAERWIVTLAKFFKRLDPYLILNLSGQSDSILLEDVPKTTKILSNFYLNPEKIINYLSDADVVVSWCFDLNINLKDKLNCPTIDVSHSDPSWKNHSLLIKSSSKRSKYHVGVSKVAASAFEKNDLTVIYNGIDTERLKEFKGRLKQREEWDCKDKKVVIFLSRLSEEKNPRILLECSNLFDESWKFLFVDIGSLKKEFNAINKTNVKIVKKTNNIADYYSGADVVVLPSDIEGMPLVLLESWFCSVPVVTTKHNSYLELMDMHGELCLSTKVRPTAIEFSDKIREAFDKGRNSDRVVLAKTIVENNYTHQTMIKNWEDYIFLKIKEHNENINA
jgi:glycosyltransferase involved in cell wall biosynthesis